MPVPEQLEIVTVHYPVSAHPHPAIVLSTSEANTDWVVCVMITSNGMVDELSFPLADEMTDKPFTKVSQVRLHLLGGFDADFVHRDRRPNKMKKPAFARLIKAINSVTFGQD